MAIVTPEKIFVDPKDEITFIVERVLNSAKEQVILVVPQNSLLLSSVLSINILSRELLDRKNNAVIVTEDEYGKLIAQKAGFLVVNKVSQITADMWDKAEASKISIKSQLDARKRDLLNNYTGEETIKEKRDQRSETRDQYATEGQQLDAQSSELETESHPNLPVVEPETVDQIEASNKEAESITEEEPIPESVVEESEADLIVEISEEDLLEKTSEEVVDELQESLDRYKKPRQETKVVELDGLVVFAGGDIKSTQKAPINGKIAQSFDENDEFMTDSIEPNNRLRMASQVGGDNFTGRDFTKVVKAKNKPFAFLDGILPKRKSTDPDSLLNAKTPTANPLRKKILIGVGVMALIAFLASGYYFTYQASEVTITLELKKEDVEFSEKIIADPVLTTVDQTSNSIPGELIKQENLSLSRTGTANGEGEKGSKAKGFVTIYNTTTSEIKINAGTKVTSVATNRRYVLVNNVTLQSATTTSESITTISIADDVPIEAENVGTDYNISEVDSNTIFTIEGFTGVDNVYAKRFKPVEGGTSVKFTAVSEDNVKSLKDTMVPELQTQGVTKLKAFVPTGYILINESIKFTEKEVTPFPKVGEESKDGTFSLSISGEVSALAVKEDDLKSILTRLASRSEDTKNLIVDSLENFTVSEVVTNEDKTSFTISSKGKVTSEVIQEEIKQDLSGMSVEDARDYLSNLEEVSKVRIKFTPAFIPGALRKVPSDSARVVIETN